jgi:hypothetical protein
MVSSGARSQKKKYRVVETPEGCASPFEEEKKTFEAET